jgi:hypothetical protein
LSGPARADLRRRLGRAGIGSRRHVDAVAELVEGEAVVAAVVTVWQRRGWVAAATDVGLRLARRPRLLGRGRSHAFDWDDLTEIATGPERVSLVFGPERVDLLGGTPHDELVLLVDEARSRLDADKPRLQELRELARRKLGRLLAIGFEPTVEALPDRLEPGEQVQRLATATIDFNGLLVLTDRRLLLVDTTIRRTGERWWELDRDAIRETAPVERGLRLVVEEGEVTVTDFLPAERLDEFAAVLVRA